MGGWQKEHGVGGWQVAPEVVMVIAEVVTLPTKTKIKTGI